ncbi:MAG: hypothetical protein ACOCZX_02010 [Candidatus Bipolaricaulota bacterium]
MEIQRCRSKFKALVVLSLVGAFVLLTSSPVDAQTRWGIGGKLTGQLPLITGSVEWSNVKLELGTFYTRADGVDVTFVSAEGKYLFSRRGNVLRPYLGLNGMTINATYAGSLTTISGGGAIGGLSWLPFPYLNFEAGLGYITFTGLEYDGYGFPINTGGTIFSMGANWRF